MDEKATGFVGYMAGAGQFYMDKVKMGAKKTDNAEAHRNWAKALETLWADLKAYVKEYHTQKLVWNPPKKVRRMAGSGARAGADKDDNATDSESAFKALLDGPLKAFVAASNKIGGDVAKQASSFAGAWGA